MVETLGLGADFAGAGESAVGGASVEGFGWVGECAGDEGKEGDLGLHFGKFEVFERLEGLKL